MLAAPCKNKNKRLGRDTTLTCARGHEHVFIYSDMVGLPCLHAHTHLPARICFSHHPPPSLLLHWGLIGSGSGWVWTRHDHYQAFSGWHGISQHSTLLTISPAHALTTHHHYHLHTCLLSLACLSMSSLHAKHISLWDILFQHDMVDIFGGTGQGQDGTGWWVNK